MFETLEARKLLSASVASVVKTIGATSGNFAASNVPQFDNLTGTVHDSNGNALTDGDTGIDVDSSLSIHILANGTGSIDAQHLTRSSVVITDTTTGTVFSSPTTGVNALSKIITSGGGDVVVVTPKGKWAANHDYTIELNAPSVTAQNIIRTADGSGSTDFPDTTIHFSTGSYFARPTTGFTSAFNNAVAQAAAGNKSFTAVTWGPDQRLYAADTQGYIYAFTVGSDGTLSNKQTITTIRDHFGGNRLITGIVFKPNSTPQNMEMWVSDGQFRFGNNPSGSDDVQKSANNFTGEIDALSGTGLTNIEPLVINIPRSVKDHTNNQIVFSPDGRTAYFGIAAMNAMGAADSTWGNRVENIYSATIMQLRASGASSVYTYIRSHGAVDLMIDGDQNTNATGLVPGTTHYNIYKGSNPLRIYADGIRNDFDMVFASNGHLYAAINGSSSGGNTPATPSDLSTVPVANRPDKDAKDANGNYLYHNSDGSYKPYAGPTAPALTNVATVEEDTLLDVKNGAYYGHPDPARGEYVIDGGNPTSGVDPYEFAGTGASGSYGYPTGQQPDRNYTLPVYDFGLDFSPDGIIQYKSVGGMNEDLNNYLIVARYSNGGDLLALQPKNDGSIGLTQAGIPGVTGLGTPLDVIEDPNTGNLYVTVLTDETGNSSNSGSIMLLTPKTQSTGTGVATLEKNKMSFYVTAGDKSGATNSVTLTNTGNAALTFNWKQTKITGVNRTNYIVTNLPTENKTLEPNDAITFNVKAVLAKGQTIPASQHSTLAISIGGSYQTVNLRLFPATTNTQSFNPVAAHSVTTGAATTSSIVSQIDTDSTLKDDLLN